MEPTFMKDVTYSLQSLWCSHVLNFGIEVIITWKIFFNYAVVKYAYTKLLKVKPTTESW